MMENVLMEDLVKDEYKVLGTDSITHNKRKVHRTLFKHKEYFDSRVRRSLKQNHSKPPHIYGLLNVHKEKILLRPIVSSRFGPVYQLSKF